jgi:Family of unknown function (DUF5908)
MPLEISEIGVHMAVGGAPAVKGQAPPAATTGNDGAISPVRMEEIVEACVQQVLRTLRMSGER